ncbi:HpcH/HpaI aldolase family protein [Acidocella aminolytica]|uniref:Aldolase/citrate lyase n=1 Tax=Acidocella aminolytica 101 = DSM 11237 TaxID=1120923 RepID=A0A0D6PK36_9PROT|nr:aldolase/citrate lyase family protein [Acidocella aminolytica]GAN81573.1 aldolase/citrate lyase [Acidocella aminolytica 101 = DSM 11237]GBQ36038.1 2,4-dihydroxyhept-2-ene-1,7-dioic acid aldolase [Acidocella aminolytica 101 = DSM 11237]SHF47737.1 2-keto-3-deoxy-L-rhamnonate aldolase RhmA [Acidocella aminolytica 101 = DSM 11237]
MPATSSQDSAGLPAPTDFRARLSRQEVLTGTFIKTPTGHAIEIFGELGYDFVVIDEEHAPFDRGAIDNAILAARASGTAAFVRIASPSASNILSVLDCGATGILAPHVASAARAREIAAAARYKGGKRGFSGSPRAGGYGAVPMWSHVEAQDRMVTVIAQIEDPEALDEIEEIARTEGVDALFLGRGDLSVALGAASPEAGEVKHACAKVIAAARDAGKPVAAFVGSAREAQALHALGVCAFIVSSDQGFMREAAKAALVGMRQIGENAVPVTGKEGALA